MGNIKSSYVFKNIFSFMDKKTKLIILKYNKIFQKQLNIDVNDYRRLSGKYIKFEENRKGEEHDSYYHSLVFTGEYLNGKRHGHGKEYNKNGEIKFEGEYLNGKRDGYGKEFNKFGKVKYDGVYLKGNKWNGKGYGVCNNIVYEIKNGNGFSKEYHYNGQRKFEGEYRNGWKHGKAKEYNKYGKLEFEGEYLFGKKGMEKRQNLINLMK